MNKKYGPLYDYDFQDRARDLRTEASTLKTEIFRATVMKKDLDQKVINGFNSFVNDYLRFWEEYAEELQKQMKECKAAPGVATIDYTTVKQWVYGNYDYASILQFADGVVQGVMSEKFEEPSDVEDFFEHTVKKAFNNMGASVAGLIENGMNFEAHPATEVDAKTFGTIASYNKLFDGRTRTELYKAIAKTIEYFTTDIGAKQFPNQKDVKLFVSMINQVVEYIVYSLTVYALRIYVIQVYSREFIFSSAKGSNVAYTTESAEDKDDKKDDEEKKPMKVDVPSVKDTSVSEKFVPVRVFHDSNEAVFKDPDKGREVVTVLKDFLKQTGAPTNDTLNKVDSLDYPWYYGTDETKDNCFIAKIRNNPIYAFLHGKGNNLHCGTTDSDIAEMHQVLKELLYNRAQGMEGTSSPKQDLLHIIRGTTVDDTLKGYQKLASDLADCTIVLLSQLKRSLNSVIEWKKREDRDPQWNTTTDSLASECLRMIADFYREIAGAIYQRGMDIELHINDLHS
ncbi:MAG: hypothetical protein NC548_53215, partial [Lachnospiraceae bacterium]|nr:hypothetical protein [Lachnospiraceae bacterium]